MLSWIWWRHKLCLLFPNFYTEYDLEARKAKCCKRMTLATEYVYLLYFIKMWKLKLYLLKEIGSKQAFYLAFGLFKFLERKRNIAFVLYVFQSHQNHDFTSFSVYFQSILHLPKLVEILQVLKGKRNFMPGKRYQFYCIVFWGKESLCSEGGEATGKSLT